MSNNTTIKAPQQLSLFDEMVKAFAFVDEAEENRRAWHDVAKAELKKVRILYNAQKQIDPATPEWNIVLDAIREQYANSDPETTEEAAPETTENNEGESVQS